jgi:hypothetical protein
MTTPYRELYVAPARPPADLAVGHCPWCRAAVEFRRALRNAVCAACGARYATAQALVVAEKTEVATAGRAGPRLSTAQEQPSAVGPVAWGMRFAALVVLLGLVALSLAMQPGGVILWTMAIAVGLVSFIRRAMK